MNASPGRVSLLVMALAVLLRAASDYSYALSLSKRSPLLKEPFIVTFEVNQTDPSKVMFFDFGIKSGDALFVHRLDRVVDEGYHARKERYIYLLYPLREGEVEVGFDLLVRRGNDELLSSAFTGGRYNVKSVETDDRLEPIPSETVSTRPLPVAAKLVGRFSMERRIDRRRIGSHEPIYLTVKLDGVGYAPDLERLDLLPPIEGVRVFVDDPQIRRRYANDGIHVEATFRYALVSEDDFTIPKLDIEAFDPEGGRAYRLEAPPLQIPVEPVERSSLVERRESPARIDSPLEAIGSSLLSLALFAAGWIGALLFQRLRALYVTPGGGEGEWGRRVASCKDAKMLLKLLLLEDPRRYEPWISRLEDALYTGEAIDLKKVKREVLNGR